MFLAAGLGTRLRPYTESEPKGLLPLCGVPLAQYALDQACEAGVIEGVINIHHQAQRASQGFLSLNRDQLRLRLSDESDCLMGSAGGLRRGLEILGGREPFFFLNTDTVSDFNLKELAAEHIRLHKTRGVTLTLVLFKEAPPPGEYTQIDVDPQTQLISQVGSKRRGAQFFTGMGIIEPEALRDVPLDRASDFLSQILLPTIAKRQAGALVRQRAWYDIGSPELWWRAHFDLIRRLETGSVSSRIRRRIETVARRAGNLIWIDREISGWRPGPEVFGPAFIGKKNGSVVLPSNLRLGPEAVLYLDRESGDPKKLDGYQRLISWGRHSTLFD